MKLFRLYTDSSGMMLNYIAVYYGMCKCLPQLLRAFGAMHF